MDDYKLVLGMEFFDKVQAILITFTNILCILDKGRVCMVTMERGTKSGAKMMSAMQLETDFKELKQNTSDISNDVETSRDTKHVLEEFRGAISRVLPERHALESCSKGRRRARRRHRVTKDEQGSTMVEAKGESSMPVKARHVGDPTVLKEMHDEDVASLVITRKHADCSRAKKAGHTGNLNVPSMTAVFQQYGKRKMSTHFIRTVTNVGEAKSVYSVSLRPPRGMNMTVEPMKLVFRRVGQKLNFLVRVKVVAMKLSPGSSVTKSGSIEWSDGKHFVRSPVVVTMQEPL
ncbi:subtilase family protein [Artemisia annua]|uniref:Subtilase family protein n=1 Tax=Artemisia annua TaxID=35608 RepID=A0A2U1NWZ6_ARTAN|nr:subtilase family protein [Artemisia annua]